MPTTIENAVVTNIDRFDQSICGKILYTMEFLAAAFRFSCKRRSAASLASFSRCCFLQTENRHKLIRFAHARICCNDAINRLRTLLLSFFARPIRSVPVDTFHTISPHFAVNIRMVSLREAEVRRWNEFTFTNNVTDLSHLRQ